MSLSKYPNNQFSHFLSMLAINYSNKRGGPEVTEENISDLILLYIHIEGEEQFFMLKDEVNEILKNKDGKLFKDKIWRNEEEIDLVLSVIAVKR